MIDALDTITLGVSAPDAALGDYAALLGHPPGTAKSLQVANVRLEFAHNPPSAGQGLAAMTFATSDLAKARHLLARRAMRLHFAAENGAGRLHLATDSTHGVPLSLVERPALPANNSSSEADTAAASALDHVVIRTANPERAVALYAGRLDLSLRLDRSEPSWGARLLFFRCGDLVVEIAHDLKAGVSDEPDKLWGLSWRVPDIARAHARLKAAGVEVSDVRIGRRPGTRIVTVKSHTAGVPTIMIGGDKPASAI